VAAGLLATGSRFLGTVEPAAALVQAIVARGGDLRQAATAEVTERLTRGEMVPGLGHTLHAQVDPRVARLLAVAQERGLAGAHVAALGAAADEAREQLGRRLVANAAGAVGAVLSDLGYPASIVKGFAIVARAGGLVAHMADEMRNPIARDVWVGAHERQARHT
jgi:citrate synthase